MAVYNSLYHGGTVQFTQRLDDCMFDCGTMCRSFPSSESQANMFSEELKNYSTINVAGHNAHLLPQSPSIWV